MYLDAAHVTVRGLSVSWSSPRADGVRRHFCPRCGGRVYNEYRGLVGVFPASRRAVDALPDSWRPRADIYVAERTQHWLPSLELQYQGDAVRDPLTRALVPSQTTKP